MNNIASERVDLMLNPPRLGKLIRENLDYRDWNTNEATVQCEFRYEYGTLSPLQMANQANCEPMRVHRSQVVEYRMRTLHE